MGNDPLIRKHTELGDGLLPWAIGLFLVTLGVWWLGRRLARPVEAAADGPAAGGARWRSPASLRTVAAVLAVVVSAGAVVDVYRIGESGAKAAWHDNYDKSAGGQHG